MSLPLAMLLCFVGAWAVDLAICRYFWRKHGSGIAFSQFCHGIGATWYLLLYSDLYKVFGLRFRFGDDETQAIERDVRRPEFANVNIWRRLSLGCWLVVLLVIFIRLQAPPP